MLVDVDQSVRAAGGYLIQLMPGAGDAVIDRLEAGIRKAGPVTPMLEAGLTPEKILEKVFDGLEFEVLETETVDYRCYCSRERVRSTLIMLGKDELRQIVEKREPVQVSCQFCDKVYDFGPEEIQEILKGIEKSES